jgi:hypothetical protein
MSLPPFKLTEGTAVYLAAPGIGASFSHKGECVQAQYEEVNLRTSYKMTNIPHY